MFGSKGKLMALWSLRLNEKWNTKEYWTFRGCDFYSTYVIVILEAFWWINLPFLQLSVRLIQVSSSGSKLFSKLTDSNWLVLSLDWIVLLGLKLTLAIPVNLLAPSHSLAYYIPPTICLYKTDPPPPFLLCAHCSPKSPFFLVSSLEN
jgi:hypothetical protein